jgi:hypothetical protein
MSKTFFVIYVRGESACGVNDLIYNADGTIDDQATGLTWMQDDSGHFEVQVDQIGANVRSIGPHAGTLFVIYVCGSVFLATWVDRRNGQYEVYFNIMDVCF